MVSNPQCLTWEEIVCLFNLAKGSVSCVGFAKSPGRRCQMARNRNAVRLAYGVLDNMTPLRYGIGTKAKQDLSEIAGLMLCHHHVDQSRHVIFGWTKKAEEEIGKLNKPPRHQENNSSQTRAELQEALEEILERLRRLEKESQGNPASRNFNSGQKTHAWNDGPFTKTKSNTFGSDPFTPRPPWAGAFNSPLNFENDPHSRGATGSSCHGPDQKPKNATHSSSRSTTPPPNHPKPAYKSAPKQAPRPAPTPTPKPEPTPTKKTERQIWDETWDKYLASWVHLDKNPKNLDLKVPWPTKSGNVADVTEENVRRFFWEGPSNGKKAGEEWFSSMRAETKRWHTDKIMARFAPGAVAQHKKALDLIAQVVIILWQDSKKNRHKS
ncbi:hypothetical protein NLG97_g6589 [Lecanicillium saksenae]|uniref:Uncharacterized protein n=1 Tax=Lecanicillium saksenae TaxID=468837 RepID=A0ACC1QQW5_9HYPO|nr:hypothetical protein NLG97_g6589 [Lecanicillium saksenae]